MEEPSVLDYVKSKLAFWKQSSIEIPQPEPQSEAQHAPDGEIEPTPAAMQPVQVYAAPLAQASAAGLLLTLGALLAALIAQGFLEPPNRTIPAAAMLYAISAVLLGAAFWRGFVRPAAVPEDDLSAGSLRFRWEGLAVGVVLMVMAFFAFTSPQNPNQVAKFNLINTPIWLLSIGYLVWAFYLPREGAIGLRERVSRFLAQRDWKITITRWGLLVLVVIAVILFFRFYRLNSLPAEMVSDHAEKLLDVSDVLNGDYYIFFLRNTGREFFQFYWTALMTKLFPVGVSFMALKLGTTLIGLWTLYYMYRLGKEIADRRVALLAVLFTGFSYWANIQSRIGLRFPLYPGFLAPVLFHVIRGLRTSNRNDFIWAGLWLGMGLHGYTSYRIVPFVVVAIFVIYMLHHRCSEKIRFSLVGLFILILVSLAVFMPLMRFTIDHYDDVASRSLTRLSDLERPLPGSPVEIFFQNTWTALVMFFWDNGDVWVHSIVHRPAMDVISAALLFLGFVLVVLRYARKRTWTDLALLLIIPLLLLPSILSLAFPNENPNLNRTAGAYIPAFLMLGLGLDAVLRVLNRSLPPRLGSLAVWGLGLGLVVFSASNNFNLVFKDYDKSMRQSGWNSSEMGAVIREFDESLGEGRNAWVVAFPYWVDTRLVAVNAGYPTRDMGIAPDQLASTQGDPRAKLFLLNQQDETGLLALRSLYPEGRYWLYPSRTEGKDFMIFLVPPREDMLPAETFGSQ